MRNCGPSFPQHNLTFLRLQHYLVYKMLSTYLNTLPYTKFVVIEDSVSAKGNEVLEYLVKNHERKSDYRTHFLIFESNFYKIKNGHNVCVCHDFTSDSRNWFNKSNDFKTVLSNLNENCVIVVDSLAHVLYRFGVSETYKLLTELKNKKNIQQIITVLHTDLFENKDKIIKYFRHISSLYIELELKKRLSYLYKKSQRKIINQIENYRFENKQFITETIKKPDKEIINETLNSLPENLSTFKIGLTEKDKESRDNLILPYLPKDDLSDGRIHYSFDEIDDWDEEDPDDDLDI